MFTKSAIFDTVNKLRDSTNQDEFVVTMQILTEILAKVESNLPPVGAEGLMKARDVWVARTANDSALTKCRIECWDFLDAKHGNSTSIADSEDAATRALICVLWPADEDEADISETVEWFVDMMNRYIELEQSA